MNVTYERRAEKESTREKLLRAMITKDLIIFSFILSEFSTRLRRA
jgi:hypothetical protein